MNRHLSPKYEQLARIAREKDRARSHAMRRTVRSIAPHPIAHETPKECLCAMCGQQAAEFRDALSLREYTISRMCQACQDSIFNTGDE